MFSVQSSFDIGLTSYDLHEREYVHIISGHRELANVVMTAIRQTVSNPTHVFTSSYSIQRLQFVSEDVVTPRGKPMNVIIQIDKDLGRVITASPRAKTSGRLVWDAASGFYVSYDEDSNILYMSQGAATVAYASEDADEPRIWWRFKDEDNAHAGVTVFEASQVWSDSSDLLTDRASKFLDLSRTLIRERVERALHTAS